MKKRILLIGPVTSVENNLIGGATISFGYLVDYFLRNEEEVRIINTKKYFGFFNSLRNAISVVTQLIFSGRLADIVFLNSSRGGTKFLAPILYYFSKLFNCKFVFRPFGGDMNVYTQDYGWLAEQLFKRTVLKADILYLQTKELVRFYGKGNQLTTSRRKPEIIRSGPFEKRFVYLGFVNVAKGITYLLDAIKKLPPDYTVHIYGPIKDDLYSNLPAEIYKGIIAKEDVLATLVEYDVLVLPTTYEGEGYPGVIIEAYSVGIPVITTKWKAIPEIVQDGKTGLLINPHSSSELYKAMQSIDEEQFNELSLNARQYFNDTFDEEIVLGRVRKEIKEL